MARKKQNTGSSDKRRSTAVEAFDLRKVDPHGRLDVLVAGGIERLAQLRVPELVPVLENKRGVIHAAINEKLGPHALGFDLVGLLEQLKPYAPLLMAIGTSALNNLKAQQQKPQEKVKEQAA